MRLHIGEVRRQLVSHNLVCPSGPQGLCPSGDATANHHLERATRVDTCRLVSMGGRSTKAATQLASRGWVPHGLRRTTASLAVCAGANVRVVQRLLGHATAAMTLDRYGHLLDDDLIAVADALSNAIERTAVSLRIQ